MFSPTNVFIMGFIDYEPVNPYGLISRFEFHTMKPALKLADSTIYSNIKGLHKRGMIDYCLEQNSNMPAKKIYSITEKGKEELDKSLEAYLSDYHPEWMGFIISTIFMYRFSRETVIGFLQKRREVLQKHADLKAEELQFVLRNQDKLPYITALGGAMMLDEHFRGELKVTVELIHMLQKIETWPETFLPEYSAKYQEFMQKRHPKQTTRH